MHRISGWAVIEKFKFFTYLEPPRCKSTSKYFLGRLTIRVFSRLSQVISRRWSAASLT